MVDLSGLTLVAGTLAAAQISEPITLISLVIVSIVNALMYFIKKK